MPTNSAGPERIFALMTVTKTKYRNLLSIKNLNDLLNLRMNKMDMSLMDYFGVIDDRED